MWRSVIDWVLSDVYPLSETSCSVDSGASGSAGEPGRSWATGLLQATARILAEHEALVTRAEELESRAGDPEAFDRFVKSLVPVVDAVERVLHYARESTPSEELDNWLKSVEGVYFRLLNTLERQGLEAINTVGKPVDLNCQEVVEYIPSKEHGHDHVVSERQKGYRFRGKLIRDAKVVVAYNPKDR